MLESDIKITLKE